MFFIKLQQPGYKTVQSTEYWVNCHTGVTEKAVLLLFLPLLLFFFPGKPAQSITANF